MKYPANTDTKYILKRAIALKNSKVSALQLKIYLLWEDQYSPYVVALNCFI